MDVGGNGMDKQGVYDFLKQRGVWFVVTDHKPLFSMDDVCDVEFPFPEGDAKNLFLRDKKKRNWYLITVNGDKIVDLKKFREEEGTRALTFGSPEELMDKLGLIPGSVTPFGLLNDEERVVKYYIDEDFFHNYNGDEREGCHGIIAIHPNDNTATVSMETDELLNILKEHGTEIKVIKVPEKQAFSAPQKK